MTRYITIAGRKQVGKDTSAQMIKRILVEQGTDERRVHVVHFADALKEATSAIFGIPLADMETEAGKQSKTEILWPVDDGPAYNDEGGDEPTVWHPYEERLLGLDTPSNPRLPEFMTVREILQFVGTELFRLQMDPDIWVKSIFRRHYRDDDIILVADCRFPNEASYSRERGLLLKVERNRPDSGDMHLSETALDDYDDYHHTVINNGSFTDLKDQLQTILSQEGF